MAEVSTSHKFTSGKSDGSDATLVQPSNWNADHNFGAGTNGDLLLRDTGATDGASWLASAATGKVLISGGAGVAPSYSDSPAIKALTLDDTTTSVTGIVFKGSDRFLHNFHHPTGGGAVPTGQNTFLGVNAGNFTTGSTATVTSHASSNTAVGASSMSSVTTGYGNAALGQAALNAITTGYYNAGFGRGALASTTEGYQNTGVGQEALNANTTGSLNTAVGHMAGRFQADGSTAMTTAQQSVYLGASVKGYSNSDSNAIVIGYNAIGVGANKGVFGNSSLTDVYFGSGTAVANIHAKSLTLADGETTSSATDLLVNPTTKASGNLLDLRVGGTSKFTVDYLGGVVAASHYAGAGTVAAAGDLRIQKSGTVAWYGTGASDDHTMVGGVKDLTDNSAIGLFEVALGANTQVGGQLFYTIVCTDGTDHQAHSGLTTFAAVNKAGVYTSNIAETSEQQANSTGTMTDTFAISTGTNKITITLNANSSLTPTKLRIYYKVLCNAPQAVTIL